MDLDPKTWWYLTRATGFVSWSLLALSMLWGLFITNKTLHRSTPPAWVLDLHRHLGGLAVIFVAVHVGVLPLDGYTQWGWADLVIPLHSDWHPVAIAWGIVATYLLLAVEISSLLQRRLPRKWWRRIHVLSFPLYVLASIHLFTAGTDTGNPYAQGLVLVVSTLIVFLTIVRVLAAAKPRETTRSRVPPRPAAAATVETAVAVTTPEPPPSPTVTPSVAVPESSADLLPAPSTRTGHRARSQEPPAQPTPMPVGARDRSLRPRSLDERVEHLRAQTRSAVERQGPTQRSDDDPALLVPSPPRP